jgi:hypothetical protein
MTLDLCDMASLGDPKPYRRTTPRRTTRVQRALFNDGIIRIVNGLDR